MNFSGLGVYVRIHKVRGELVGTKTVCVDLSGRRCEWLNVFSHGSAHHASYLL